MQRDPRDDDRDQSFVLGGADAAVKTTYVTGSGTEPEGRGGPSGRWSTATLATVVLLVIGAVAAIVVGALHALGAR